MANKTVFVGPFRIEPELRDEAHRVADELGVSLSRIVNEHFKKLVRTRQVDFPTPKQGANGEA